MPLLYKLSFCNIKKPGRLALWEDVFILGLHFAETQVGLLFGRLTKWDIFYSTILSSQFLFVFPRSPIQLRARFRLLRMTFNPLNVHAGGVSLKPETAKQDTAGRIR